ncbi:MAG: protein-L-isoaspartate O-methyltransferase, partial [Bacteroidota bacterium]
KGLPEMAPFDRILVTAGAAAVPPALREQLKVNGIMIIPVGPEGEDQRLLKVVRTGEQKWTEENLGVCQFVPFKEGLG